MMTIFERLTKEEKEAKQAIQKFNDKLDYIEMRRARLNQPDVLKIGTRVQLVRDWSQDKGLEGWDDSKHFMTPDNYATIRDIYIDSNNAISYSIVFDKETWLETGKIITEHPAQEKHTFHFAASDIIQIYEKPEFDFENVQKQIKRSDILIAMNLIKDAPNLKELIKELQNYEEGIRRHS